MKERVRCYSAFTDDFEATRDQEYQLPKDYKWVRNDIFSRILSFLIYGIALLYAFLYLRFRLHVKIRGREKLKSINEGYFIFSNHTQPLGDVFLPALSAFPKRIYTVVSPANYGIPVIGKILVYLGALPTVSTLHGIKELTRAMEYRLNNKNPIVIFPEAHVWEYYTKIRPFPVTSFKLPVKFKRPSFAMTVTYKRSRVFKRPITEIFLDGPFFASDAEVLHQQVFNAMNERSKNSDYEYIIYKKTESD